MARSSRILVAVLFAVAAAFGEENALPEPREAAFQQDVAWSPAGEWIAFSEFSGGDYAPEKWSVWIARVDGSERRLIASNAFIGTWSPDGRSLAFGSSRDGLSSIWIAERDGSYPRKLPGTGENDRQPAWSPTGDRIAFVSSPDGGRQICTMSIDGKDVRQLTSGPAKNFNPAWSPDGTEIVFYREKGDGMDQVWVVKADGSGERQITRDEANHTFPSFTPDGRIAFSWSTKEASRVVTVDAQGSNAQTAAGVDGFYARWSPDGKRVAFVGGEWPKSAIYVLDLERGSLKKIVN